MLRWFEMHLRTGYTQKIAAHDRADSKEQATQVLQQMLEEDHPGTRSTNNRKVTRFQKVSFVPFAPDSQKWTVIGLTFKTAPMGEETAPRLLAKGAQGHLLEAKAASKNEAKELFIQYQRQAGHPPEAIQVAAVVPGKVRQD